MTTDSPSRALKLPTFSDVIAARERIGLHLTPTALHRSAGLSELVGAEVWVKHENHQPVGAFKVRGGVNFAAALNDATTELMCASTGNHGQSVAFAARLLGLQATVCLPRNPNPVKAAAIRALGATVVEHGRDMDDAVQHCRGLADERGARMVNAGNESLLIAGVATESVEILEHDAEIDTIIVPVGSGSGAAGTCLAVRALRPEVQIIAVQSRAAPAAYRSWREQKLLEDRMETFAEGLATRSAYEVPQRILWRHLDDFVLVDDDEIRRAMVHMIEGTCNLVEAAGAAPLAAALRLRRRLAGRRVALIASGGNVSIPQLRALLADGAAPHRHPWSVV
jgi:threonine dehydratase